MSVKGGYLDFGEISASFGSSSAKAEADAGFATVIESLPVAARFSVFGKVGVFFWDMTATGSVGSVSDDGTDALLGIGLNYDITEQWAVRAEYESYDIGDDGISAISGKVQFTF